MDYKEKYLKYKKKYLMLKNQLGGVPCKNNTNTKTCNADENCTWILPGKCKEKSCDSLKHQKCTSRNAECKWIDKQEGSDGHCIKKK